MIYKLIKASATLFFPLTRDIISVSTRFFIGRFLLTGRDVPGYKKSRVWSGFAEKLDVRHCIIAES